MGGTAPLWMCAVAQGVSVIGDAFGQRTARICHNGSRRHFVIAVAVSSCLQMFVMLTVMQLIRPNFMKSIWLKHNNGTSYDYCSTDDGDWNNSTNKMPPDQSQVCYVQGPLTIYKAVDQCPLVLTDQILNVVYYMSEAVLYGHPLGLVLLVMASLASSFLIPELQEMVGLPTTGNNSPMIIALGIVGAVCCVFERKPPTTTTGDEENSGDDDETPRVYIANQDDGEDEPLLRDVTPVPSPRSAMLLSSTQYPNKTCSTTLISAFSLIKSWLPIVLPFTMLSFTYASFFVVQVYFNDKCKLNPWGYNSFDQVALPPFVFLTFFALDSVTVLRELTLSENDQKESFWEAVKQTWREATANKGHGIVCVLLYRTLINCRGMMYTYLSILYDLSQVYLQLTLFRVGFSCVGAVVLIVIAPRFIHATEEEKRVALFSWNLGAKSLGIACIMIALYML
eukprot:PhF_6_TR15055/c0_g1_i3/m.23642